MGATKRKLRPFILLFVAGGRPLTTAPTTDPQSNRGWPIPCSFVPCKGGAAFR